MQLEILFVVALQCLPGSAQVFFGHPTANEIINGGVPFVLTVTESITAPFFSQMTNFSLFLFAGSYSSPLTLFAWNLSTINPATIANSVSIPSSIGPDATNAYFLGIKGPLLLAPTLSVTYFSPFFTLQNMSGASSLIPTTTSQLSSPTTLTTTIRITSTASPARAISFLDQLTGVEVSLPIVDGAIDNQWELSALSILSLLATKTRTITTIATLSTTMTPVSESMASTSTSAISTATAIGMISPGSTSSSTSTPQATDVTEATSPSKQSAKMANTLIIAGLVFAALIVLFWLYLFYRKSHPPSSASSDVSSSPLRKLASVLSGLRGWSILSKGTDTHNLPIRRTKRKHSDADKMPRQGQGLEVHITRSLHRISTRHPHSPYEVNNPTQRHTFEDRYHARRESRKTILAELEGDSAVPEMPAVAGLLMNGRGWQGRESMGSEIRRWRVELDRAFEFDARRVTTAAAVSNCGMEGELGVESSTTVVLSEGKQGLVVRGREAANIVAVKRKPAPVQSPISLWNKDRELPPVPSTYIADMVVPVSRFSTRPQRDDVMEARTRDGNERVGSEARITELGDEVFKREMSVVVRRLEEADRERMARRERRRRKREELLRGGAGSSRSGSVEVREGQSAEQEAKTLLKNGDSLMRDVETIS